MAADTLVPAVHTWHQSCSLRPLELVLLLELEVVQRTGEPAEAHSMDMVPAGNTGSNCHIQHIVHILGIDVPLLPYLGLHILDTGLAAAAAAADVAVAVACGALALAWPGGLVAAPAEEHGVLAVAVASRLQLADTQCIHMLLASVVESLPVALMQSLKAAGKS